MKTPFTSQCRVGSADSGRYHDIDVEIYTLDDFQKRFLGLDPAARYAMMVPHVFYCGKIGLNVGVLIVGETASGTHAVMEVSQEQYFHMHLEHARHNGMPESHLKDYRRNPSAVGVSSLDSDEAAEATRKMTRKVVSGNSTYH